jgi:hypothetical protein
MKIKQTSTACLVFILYIKKILIKWDFLANEILQVLVKKGEIIKKNRLKNTYF